MRQRMTAAWSGASYLAHCLYGHLFDVSPALSYLTGTVVSSQGGSLAEVSVPPY